MGNGAGVMLRQVAAPCKGVQAKFDVQLFSWQLWLWLKQWSVILGK